MSSKEACLNRYHRLNSSVEPGCAVFFGADCFAGIPIGELTQALSLDIPAYNRSVESLTLPDAEKALPECVYRLSPSRVFINLGENDLSAPDFDMERFLSAYEWLLYTLNSNCPRKAQLYVVSVLSAHPMAPELNSRLKQLASDTGCTFVDISRAAGEQTELRIFEIIRCYLRNHSIRLTEAFQIAAG